MNAERADQEPEDYTEQDLSLRGRQPRNPEPVVVAGRPNESAIEGEIAAALFMLRDFLDEIETLCEDNGQNAILVEDLRALVRDRIAAAAPKLDYFYVPGGVLAPMTPR